MEAVQTIIYGVQACLSAYTLHHAYVSITNLRQYEQKPEKAAQWSQAAAGQLHKTRTTQTSSALTILSSFTTAIILLTTSHGHTWTAIYTALIDLGICHAARLHVSHFWDHKAKVPFVDGFNEAIERTQTVCGYLGYLNFARSSPHDHTLRAYSINQDTIPFMP